MFSFLVSVTCVIVLNFFACLFVYCAFCVIVCVCVCVFVLLSLRINTQGFNWNVLFRILKKVPLGMAWTFTSLKLPQRLQGSHRHNVSYGRLSISISGSTISILISAAYPWISLRISVKPNSNRICDSTLSFYIRQRNFCQDICTFYKICFLHNSEPKLTVLICSSICNGVDIDSEKLKCLQLLALRRNQGVRKSAN